MTIKSSAYPIPGAVGIAQNTPQAMLHINNNGAVFQLVLESTGTNPDMTYADNTGVKAQIRYRMTGTRGFGFAADDTHVGWRS